MLGMSIKSTPAVLLSALVLLGCAHERRPPRPVSTVTAPEPKYWPRFLRDDEAERCKEVAWKAANSAEMWERFKPKRMTTDPVKLSATRILCYLDQERFDRVEVDIPSGGRVGWHRCFIGVTVARETYEVLSMEESYWP
jgi:hypothetical protein